MSLSRKTDSTTELVTLQEAKDFLRVTFNDDNSLIDSLRKAARKWCDNYASISFFTQTWTLRLDGFPGDDRHIELWRPPVQSVTSVKYYDSNNSLQTWDSSNYIVDTKSNTARIDAINSYPDTYDRVDAVEVEYIAGYADIDDVPEDIKQAVLILIADFYEIRQNVIVGSQVNERNVTRMILDQYKDYYAIR